MSERVETGRSGSTIPTGAPSEPRHASAHGAALPGAAGRSLPRAALRAAFRAHYLGAACFREDAALIDALEGEAEPVLEALYLALAPCGPPRAMHESYALSSLLARRAATLGATPSAALALGAALAHALREAGCTVDEAEARALAIVAVEGYCAARDERVTADLLDAAARTQVFLPLAPHCVAVLLTGRHDERALGAALDRFAKQLLQDEVVSCLLDPSRLCDLDADDDGIARTVANFCATATTLGAALCVVAASPRLRARLARWLPGAALQFADDFASGHAQALVAAGHARRDPLRWLRPGWARARGSLR